MFLRPKSTSVGVAPEDGAYSCKIKCLILHISPPMLWTSAKVAKVGVYMWDTTVVNTDTEENSLSICERNAVF